MSRERESIKRIYNRILSRLETSMKRELQLSFKDNYDLVVEHVERVLRKLLISNRISNLVLSNLSSLYLDELDYSIQNAIQHLMYASAEEPDPSRYNVKFYQRLISQFDERISTFEYSSLNEVLRQILIDEDVLDEISNIIYFMPQWFKDLMKCRIRQDDYRDDLVNPDATFIPGSTEEFDGY